MGLKDWRTRRAMTDPVRGEFRVSTWYDPHPGRTPPVTILTGVLTADGVPPTPTEFPDHHSKGLPHAVLPVLVDRADPTHAVILWDDVQPVDYRADARRRAAEDAAHLGVPGTTGGSNAAAAIPQVTPEVTVTGMDDLPPWLQKAVGAALDGDEPGPVTVHYGTPPAVPGTAPGAGGRAVRAVLTAVADVAVPAYALPGPTASLCDLTLRITRPDGSSYLTQTRMGFRNAERRSRFAVLGSAVPVLVDPADETNVSVDIPAWDASAP